MIFDGLLRVSRVGTSLYIPDRLLVELFIQLSGCAPLMLRAWKGGIEDDEVN